MIFCQSVGAALVVSTLIYSGNPQILTTKIEFV